MAFCTSDWDALGEVTVPASASDAGRLAEREMSKVAHDAGQAPPARDFESSSNPVMLSLGIDKIAARARFLNLRRSLTPGKNPRIVSGNKIEGEPDGA